MTKKVTVLSGVIIFLFFILSAFEASAENKWERLVEESGNVLAEVQQMPDHGIPADLLRSCEGVAVIPSTVSGGFIIGGQYGQGVIMARNQKGGWSSPAIFTLAGGSFGWQIGGQASDIVLLIMNRRCIDGILQSKFKLGADAAASAGPVGRDAQASTDIQLKGGILSYSRSRGLFAGVKLEGAVLTEHQEGNKELYGQNLSAREILVKSKAAMPKSADGILRVLNKYPRKR